MSDKNVLVEQLGAASASNTPWPVARAADLIDKILPGAIARYKVLRDDADLNPHATNVFVEQLGVASGRYGLPELKSVGPALAGLYARYSVTRYWGTDLRDEANRFIEDHVLQWPLEERKKTLLVTLLYEAARKLPTR